MAARAPVAGLCAAEATGGWRGAAAPLPAGGGRRVTPGAATHNPHCQALLQIGVKHVVARCAQLPDFGGRSVGGKGIPSCTRAQLYERRQMSSVRLSRTIASGGCWSSGRSRWSACSSMYGSPLARSASITARQVSKGSSTAFMALGTQDVVLPASSGMRRGRNNGDPLIVSPLLAGCGRTNTASIGGARALTGRAGSLRLRAR